MWEDREDELTPAIKQDFRSPGYFERRARAAELVSNRHSKGALIELVTLLLKGQPETEQKGPSDG